LDWNVYGVCCNLASSRHKTTLTTEYITPVLRNHTGRVDFKLATFMYKTLHGRGYHGTCLAIVSSSSPTQVADYGRTTRSHLSCHGPELVWVILLLPDHRYGTVCRQICV